MPGTSPWIEPRRPCPPEGYLVRRVGAAVHHPAFPEGQRRRQGKGPSFQSPESMCTQHSGLRRGQRIKPAVVTSSADAPGRP